MPALNPEAGGGKRVGAFDLDGTLLHGLTLFDAALFAQTADHQDNVDWVTREVLEELRRDGNPERAYLNKAIAAFVLQNQGRRTPAEILHTARNGHFWPNAYSYFSFTSLLAWAWRGVNPANRLHCITHSPEFLAKPLLQESGIQVGLTDQVRFDYVSGSTYETGEDGKLTDVAHAEPDKSKTYTAVHGEGTQPELAITDSAADISLLRLAGRFAIAFCPDPRLRELAYQDRMIVINQRDPWQGSIDIQHPHRRITRISDVELRRLNQNEIIALLH